MNPELVTLLADPERLAQTLRTLADQRATMGDGVDVTLRLTFGADVLVLGFETAPDDDDDR